MEFEYALSRVPLGPEIMIETAEHLSSFDGLVSTSNHLVSGEKLVWIKTTRPIWWTAELRAIT